jgi:hypothetical protein
MYTFSHPDSGETKEVFFHMDEEPKRHIDPDGREWGRVFTSPQLSTEAGIDPWNNEDFINKTAKQKGNLGDLLDQSAELSAKRAEQHDGVDPVKKEYFKKYSKEREGQKHPKDRKSTYESKNVKIEFDD